MTKRVVLEIGYMRFGLREDISLADAARLSELLLGAYTINYKYHGTERLSVLASVISMSIEEVNVATEAEFALLANPISAAPEAIDA